MYTRLHTLVNNFLAYYAGFDVQYVNGLLQYSNLAASTLAIGFLSGVSLPESATKMHQSTERKLHRIPDTRFRIKIRN